MAQLKDSIVSGSLRVTNALYTTTLLALILNLPTSSNGTTYGPGTNGYIIKSNGTSVYWASIGSASGYGVKDSTANSALGTGTGLTTERAVYYGLVTVNNASLTRATGIYAPTSAGTANLILVSSGGTSAPTWKATASGAAYATSANGALTFGTLPVAQGGTGQTSVANIQAGKDGDGNTISSTYLKLSGGTLIGNVYHNSATGSKKFYFTRSGSNAESTAIWVDDSYTYFDVTNDETTANVKFTLHATDTESNSGAGDQTSYVTFVGVNGESTITADKFSGNLVGNVTGNVSGSSGSCTGNAASASRLNITSTDNAIARFDGTNGTIQNSTVTINDSGTMNIKGKLIVNPSYDTSNSYNEGIRINLASNGWANVHFGGAADSTNGVVDGGWLVGRRGAAGSTAGAVGDFTIEEQGSNGTGLTIHKDSGGATLYNGNLILKKTSAGLGLVLLINLVEYGKLYVATKGVAGTNTTTYTNPNNSSLTTPGYSGSVTGQTILVLGNSKGAGYNGSSYSSPGSAGTADNSQGYLRLYSSSTGYGDLTAYTGDKTRPYPSEGFSIPENKIGIMFRPGSSSYYTHVSYETNGNEALVAATQNAVTSFIFVNGESYANVASDRWTKLTGASGAGNAPGLLIKNNCVSIGELIPNGTSPTYKLNVNGTSNFKDNMQILGSLSVNGNATFASIPTAPTPAATSNDTSVATTAFVMNAFTANDAMVFKGVINANSALPANHVLGWTYRIGTAGTYANKTCEVGDIIICVTDGTSANNDHWAVIQNNIDGAIYRGTNAFTDANIIIADSTNGKVKSSGKTLTTTAPASDSGDTTIPTSKAVWSAISGASGYGKTGTVTKIIAGTGLNTSADLAETATKGNITTSGTLYLTLSGVTANTYGNTSQLTPSHGGTFNIPYFTVDKYGRITSASTTTVKLPTDNNTDTKVNVVTRGTTKSYILGDTAAPPNSAAAHTAVAESYIYMTSTAGQMSAKSYSFNDGASTPTEKAQIIYNTTTGCLEIIVA